MIVVAISDFTAFAMKTKFPGETEIMLGRPKSNFIMSEYSTDDDEL